MLSYKSYKSEYNANIFQLPLGFLVGNRLLTSTCIANKIYIEAHVPTNQRRQLIKKRFEELHVIDTYSTFQAFRELSNKSSQK